MAVVHDGARLPGTTETSPAVSKAALSEVTVAYSGHLYPWKGVDVLLEALARVPAVRASSSAGMTKSLTSRACEPMPHGSDSRTASPFTGLVPPAEWPDA